MTSLIKSLENTNWMEWMMKLGALYTGMLSLIRFATIILTWSILKKPTRLKRTLSVLSVSTAIKVILKTSSKMFSPRIGLRKLFYGISLSFVQLQKICTKEKCYTVKSVAKIFVFQTTELNQDILLSYLSHKKKCGAKS